MERLLTIREVAGYLHFPPETVRAMARDGRIPAIKAGRLWRFRLGEVEAWLEARRNRALVPDLEAACEN